MKKNNYWWLTIVLITTNFVFTPRKGYCHPLRAPSPPLPHTLFWLLHQHGATDWIHTNIQPLPALFFTQSHRWIVKGQGQRFLKILVSAITWKIIIGSLHFFTWTYPWVWRSPDYIFSFPPIIKMAATWWLIFFCQTQFFNLIIPLKPVTYRFSGSGSLLALSVFMCDRKWGYGGHLDFLI